MCENLLDNMYIEKRKEEYRIKLLKIRETDIDIYNKLESIVYKLSEKKLEKNNKQTYKALGYSTVSSALFGIKWYNERIILTQKWIKQRR